MYSKIMPTGLVNAAHQGTQAEQEDTPSQAEAPGQAAPEASPLPTPAPPPPAFTPASVQIREHSTASVVNLMEYLVADRLDGAFKKFNCCKCDKCRKDVVALALNQLPTKYVVAEQEEIPRLVQEISGSEVSTAIVHAVLVVRSHPRH